MSQSLYLHVPPKPDPIPPDSPPGDLPVDPDPDVPDIDLPPSEMPVVPDKFGAATRRVRD